MQEIPIASGASQGRSLRVRRSFGRALALWLGLGGCGEQGVVPPRAAGGEVAQQGDSPLPTTGGEAAAASVSQVGQRGDVPPRGIGGESAAPVPRVAQQGDVPGDEAAAAYSAPVARVVRRGSVYQVKIDSTLSSGSTATIEAAVKVLNADARMAVLDVHIKDFSTHKGSLFKDVNVETSVLDDGSWPWPILTVRHADPRIVEIVQSAVDTIAVRECLRPARSHAPGDEWTEQFNVGSTSWKVSPPEVRADGTWIAYSRVDRGVASRGSTIDERDKVMYEVTQRLRTDDGFVGECVVHNYATAHAPPGAAGGPVRNSTRITSVQAD